MISETKIQPSTIEKINIFVILFVLSVLCVIIMAMGGYILVEHVIDSPHPDRERVYGMQIRMILKTLGLLIFCTVIFAVMPFGRHVTKVTVVKLREEFNKQENNFCSKALTVILYFGIIIIFIIILDKI